MSEENVKAKKKKLDHQERSLEEREQQVSETRDNLRRLELEFREKNAILEILLKVNHP